MKGKKRSVKKIFWQMLPGVAAGWLLVFSSGANLSGPNPKSLEPATISKTALPADSVDKQTGLIKAPGYVLVKENCLRCHSPKLITDKRATRDGWLATIRWMQQTQGLGHLGKAEPEILDYLAAHYAPTYEGRRLKT